MKKERITSLEVGTIITRINTRDLMPHHGRCVRQMMKAGTAKVVMVTKMACGEEWATLESTHPMQRLLGVVSVPTSCIVSVVSAEPQTETAVLLS